MKKELTRSLKFVSMWVVLAMLFCFGVYLIKGYDSAIQFLGGYVIEWSLSIDNLFVFLSIFIAFGIKNHEQHRVLNWGIIGAIVLRFAFILVGIKIVTTFEWILYIFGIILIINGVKMFGHEKEKDPHDSRVIKGLSKILPMTREMHGDRFMVKEESERHGVVKERRMFTPLFAIMIFIIFTDIIFAVDSVPAVLSMSTDLFIVYTSNMFAVLGLRQLFFVIEILHERFRYVKYGVGIILAFTGVKLGILAFHIEIGTLASICVIVGVLTLSIVLSAVISGRQERKEAASGVEEKDLVDELLKEDEETEEDSQM